MFLFVNASCLISSKVIWNVAKNSSDEAKIESTYLFKDYLYFNREQFVSY